MIPSRASLLTLLLAALVVAAPLPYAGVGAAAQAGLRLAAFAALILAAMALRRPAHLKPLLFPLAAMAGIALLGLLQSVGLPRVLAAISPEHVRLHAQAAGVTAPGEEVGRIALSLAPQVSRSSAVGWLAMAALLLAAFVAARRRRRSRWLAWAIVAGGLIQVVAGGRAALAVSHFRLRGTFVNPNHLALYLEIALAIAFAWSCWAGVRARREEAVERRLMLLAPPLVSWLILMAGLVLTGSRAGLAAALAATLLQAALFARERGNWRPAIVGLAASALGLAVAATFAGDKLFGRVLGTSLYEVTWSGRFRVWGLSLELVELFPVTGSGLGTFLQALPLVQPPEMVGEVWARAHNDALELLVTGGVIAAALGLVGLIGLLRALWKTCSEGHRTEDRMAGLAAFGALAAVGLHELMDFGLTLPANAIALCVVLGVAVRAGERRWAP
jgi:O-antigen ligase